MSGDVAVSTIPRAFFPHVLSSSRPLTAPVVSRLVSHSEIYKFEDAPDHASTELERRQDSTRDTLPPRGGDAIHSAHPRR